MEHAEKKNSYTLNAQCSYTNTFLLNFYTLFCDLMRTDDENKNAIGGNRLLCAGRSVLVLCVCVCTSNGE